MERRRRRDRFRRRKRHNPVEEVDYENAVEFVVRRKMYVDGYWVGAGDAGGKEEEDGISVGTTHSDIDGHFTDPTTANTFAAPGEERHVLGSRIDRVENQDER